MIQVRWQLYQHRARFLWLSFYNKCCSEIICFLAGRFTAWVSFKDTEWWQKKKTLSTFETETKNTFRRQLINVLLILSEYTFIILSNFAWLAKKSIDLCLICSRMESKDLHMQNTTFGEKGNFFRQTELVRIHFIFLNKELVTSSV